jgi:hypothetical protein
MKPNVKILFVWKHKRTRTFGRPRRRWTNNNTMDLQEWQGEGRIRLSRVAFLVLSLKNVMCMAQMPRRTFSPVSYSADHVFKFRPEIRFRVMSPSYLFPFTLRNFWNNHLNLTTAFPTSSSLTNRLHGVTSQKNIGRHFSHCTVYYLLPI